jgi:hypothetical protein
MTLVHGQCRAEWCGTPTPTAAVGAADCDATVAYAGRMKSELKIIKR